MIQANKLCTIGDCEMPLVARGLCRKHYARWRKHGNPHTMLHKRSVGSNLAERLWSRIAITADPERCWLWEGANADGYGVMRFKKQKYRATRAVWLVVHGELPKLHMLHKCDNPPCCNPNHLYEGTDADNSKEMVERNRQAKGMSVAGAKLTDAKVREIKRRLANKETQTSIALDFQVSVGTVCLINKGDTWKHI